ncbi:hypothetical protein OE88DRAFT_1658392 [Heliocybe sulcata]|uniref:Fork-head domain-containing protein n=1 Tax=Heliocybe sulcata TaxID=5364 RepID=A0A5C3N346_9AGAM|nr:hypothetical protein OE88DRAFT_1658392 [Heliocybe sulcata]
MAEPPTAPSAQEPDVYEILRALGMSREDLTRYTVEMRQFLASDKSTSLRAFSQDRSESREAGRPPSRSLSRSRSTSVVNASFARPQSPSPAAPVKSEYLEPPLPALRARPSMDQVIEKKNRERRKLKREKERRRAQQPSPSPPRSISLDTFMHGGGPARVPSPEPRPSSSQLQPEATDVSPSHLRYYRYYDEAYSPRLPELGVPSSSRASSPSLYSRGNTLPMPKAPPVTPAKQNNYYRAAMAQSSPDRSSIPSSSPVRIINTVSSPGPMGPPPAESEYENLPFKLPSGPYSSAKPQQSYAALIGQAILASPNHRLTLQEIYEYITIVYPHFKRGGGEQTWMNSIRHVLSTTAVFRKVNREELDDNARGGEGAMGGKPKGRTLWAIWNDDLECFKNGNFDKRFCKNMMDGSKGKKRSAEDSGGKKAKRAKKSGPEYAGASSSYTTSSHPELVPISHTNPLFPPLPLSRHSYNHHQPYYPIYAPSGRHMSAEVYFPPLPDYYKQIPSHPAARSSASSSALSRSSSCLSLDSRPVSPPESAASSGVPDLVPHNDTSSSSSPPLEDEGQGSPNVLARILDADIDGRSLSPAPSVASFPGLDDGPGDVFGDLGPSITLREFDRKGKASQRLPPRPESPLSRRASALKAKAKTALRSSSPPPPPIFPRMDSLLELPHTPPRKHKSSGLLQLSPVRTPISHKGLNMSPSFNSLLSHYKTHLDPPAPHPLHESNRAEDATAAEADGRAHTPLQERFDSLERRSSDSGLPFLPVTPKRLAFPNPGNTTGRTPFRSPFPSPFRSSLLGIGGIYDPNDPSAILNDELSRLGAAGDSPVGLYGRNERALLYESPDASSPSRYSRYF